MYLLREYNIQFFFFFADHDVVLNSIQNEDIQSTRMSFYQATQLVRGIESACEEKSKIAFVVGDLSFEIDAREKCGPRYGVIVAVQSHQTRFRSRLDNLLLEESLKTLKKMLSEHLE
ncbi:MAG: hypothetical protein A4S14_05450 [Proteobacteria bacterium SG_bin9]|nr:MAG: hypothetical protein A4S14_05450 [Proteobacteria bacterium SG_bin9]